MTVDEWAYTGAENNLKGSLANAMVLQEIHRYGIGARGSSSAGVLTTDSDLTITGDATGYLLAVRSSDGKVIWHENIGRMGGAPATVEFEGKQYLLVTSGNSLLAYALT